MERPDARRLFASPTSENPPSGGGSVYSESTAADETLVEQAKRLLEHFSWRGLAMIEFKIDRSTGTPYLMEINGRVWGSLQLAIDAGWTSPPYSSLRRAAALRNRARIPRRCATSIVVGGRRSPSRPRSALACAIVASSRRARSIDSDSRLFPLAARRPHGNVSVQ